MSKYRFDLKATDENNLKTIENVAEKFKSEIILMSLTRAQTDQMFKLTEDMIDTYSEIIKSFVPVAEKKLRDNINIFHQSIKEILQSSNSAYKRKKQIEQSDDFAAPEEMAIGYKWVQTVDEATKKIVRKYQQNTFQFIRPSEIIRTLFLNPDYLKMYAESVENKGHICKDGVYKDYCCGSLFQGNNSLNENPNTLLLQLYSDDFEPGEALKSKAGVHKKCAFYLIIRNMPKKLQSKLSNIYLVALANSTDIKSEAGGMDSVLDVIIADLKMLSTAGIMVNGKVVKGYLLTWCFDNLGAHAIYGLVQSFSANFYCRFCECHQNECKVSTKEDPSKLRDINSYNEMCARILEERDLDFTEKKASEIIAN